MMVRRQAAARPVTWRLWVAPVVWAVHFLAIYAFSALTCARLGSGRWFGADAVPWFVGVATLVAAALLLLTIGVALRDGRRAASSPEPAAFVYWLTAAGAALVLVALVWETLPVLLVPTCS